MSEPKGKMTHPDPKVLAEFRAGLVTGRHGARISAHLADCEHCAGLCDQLAQISAVLAAVPAPAMPDAVTRRLEGVLAAETAQRHSSERTVDPRSRDRAASPRPRRHWDFRLVALRVLAPAAAVVVLAAGGYGLSRIGASSTSSEPSGSAASAPVASAPPSTGATSRPGAGAAIEAPVRFSVVTSGTNYLPATLQRLLNQELQLPHVLGTAQQLPPGPVKGCVLRVAGPGTLALVEKARYQGRPAIVIVAASSLRDTAWVAASGCSASSDRILARTTLSGTSAS